jgi:hypothetical protein
MPSKRDVDAERLLRVAGSGLGELPDVLWCGGHPHRHETLPAGVPDHQRAGLSSGDRHDPKGSIRVVGRVVVPVVGERSDRFVDSGDMTQSLQRLEQRNGVPPPPTG